MVNEDPIEWERLQAALEGRRDEIPLVPYLPTKFPKREACFRNKHHPVGNLRTGRFPNALPVTPSSLVYSQ